MMKMMLAAAAALLTATVSASAVELAEDAVLVPEEPPPIPIFSWTGFQAGVHTGYDFGHDATSLRSRFGDVGTGFGPNGVLGGVHAGYNHALPGPSARALVVGIEGDVDGADYRKTSAPVGGAFGGSTVSARSDVKGSVRARLGVGVNRVLFYTTGGATFANFDTRYNAAPGSAAGGYDAGQRVQAGYTLGGGVEYAFLNYVTVRAEYRYSDYGSFTDTLPSAAPGLNSSVVHRESDNRLQAGLSYKFDSVLP